MPTFQSRPATSVMATQPGWGATARSAPTRQG
jgi:hypothetical protein